MPPGLRFIVTTFDRSKQYIWTSRPRPPMLPPPPPMIPSRISPSTTTTILWEYLDSRDDLTNPGYYKEADSIMMPLPKLLRNVTFWADRHCMYGPKPTVRCLAPSIDELYRSVSAGAGTGTVTDDDSDIGVNSAPTAFVGSSQATMQWALTQAEQWRKVADSRQREIMELKKMLALKD